jgi:hypothetical protein
MTNKILFRSLIIKLIPAPDAINKERAPAYALSPKHQQARSWITTASRSFDPSPKCRRLGHYHSSAY